MPDGSQCNYSTPPQGGALARGRIGRWCSVVFIVALAMAATLFYGGKIGRWNDDYYFLRQFERAAPAGHLDAPMPVRSWVLDDRLHFWRPLYRCVYTPVVIAMYQWPAALHVLAACCHMAVCCAIWGFVRWLGAGRTPATIAALGFLVYPAHFEGVFWVPCTPTAFATGMMLGALWVQGRWARLVDRGIGVATWRCVVLACIPAVITFAACALNEQPAFLVAVMPLVVWCVRAIEKERSRASGAVPRVARWWVVLAPTFLAGAAMLVYVLIANAMHPAHVHTGTGGVVGLTDLLHRMRAFAGEVLGRQELRRFASGAWREGWQALRERPSSAAILLGALVIAGAGWAWHGGRAWAMSVVRTEHRPVLQGLRLVALGAGIFLTGWGPLAFINYPASPRLAYAPGAGLAIALAGLLECLLGRVSCRAGLHVVARAFALPVLLCGMVMMIGVQHAYRSRWRADEWQAAELRRLGPEPSGALRPVFIPVRVADRPVHTGTRGFDGYFLSPLLSEWAAGWWLQLHYRRNDVVCVQGSWNAARGASAEPVVGWLDAERVQSALHLLPPAKHWDRRFEIAEIVPFEVNERGEVVLYTHVIFEGADADAPATPASSPMLLPAAAAAFEQGRAQMKVLVMPRVTQPAAHGDGTKSAN